MPSEKTKKRAYGGKLCAEHREAGHLLDGRLVCGANACQCQGRERFLSVVGLERIELANRHVSV